MVLCNRYKCYLSQFQANKSFLYKLYRGHNTIRTSEQPKSIAYMYSLCLYIIETIITWQYGWIIRVNFKDHYQVIIVSIIYKHKEYIYNLDFKTSLKCKSDSRRTQVDALWASQSIRLDLTPTQVDAQWAPQSREG